MSIPSGTRITAFTSKHTGLVNQLVTEIEIMIPNTTISMKVRGIWDTGATATVITNKIVDNLQLKPTGMSNVNTANGPTIQNTYIVDVILPNKLQVKDVTVTGASALSSGCEVLIGMDIISLGDFSITNYEGKTCLSFRFPSCHEIDYVQRPQAGIKPNKNIAAGKPGSNVSKPKKKRK